MPRPYINSELRLLVANRADWLREYFYVAQVDRSSAYQIDHIISVKHGGATTADNLAYSCIFCNIQKGSDLGSINWRTGELVRFFNPRRDLWKEHFRLNEVVIQPQTGIGEVTVRIFDFNNNERIIERQALMAVGRFPPSSALERMTK